MSPTSFSHSWSGGWFAPPVRPWIVILTAIIPFWIYLTGYDIFMYESYVLAGWPRESIASPWQRIIQHAMLLPFVLLAYLYAWRIGWPQADRVDATLRLDEGLDHAVIERLLANPAVGKDHARSIRGKSRGWQAALPVNPGLASLPREKTGGCDATVRNCGDCAWCGGAARRDGGRAAGRRA